MKQLFLESSKKAAKSAWDESKRGRRMARIDPSLPSKSFEKLIAGLPRRQAALLFQLRSGHSPLHEHLHRIGKVPSPTCPTCGNAPESVFHFLLTCPTYSAQRSKMFTRLRGHSRSLDTLLNSEPVIAPLFEFLQATQRFHATFGTVTLKTKEKERRKKKGKEVVQR